MGTRRGLLHVFRAGVISSNFWPSEEVASVRRVSLRGTLIGDTAGRGRSLRVGQPKDGQALGGSARRGVADETLRGGSSAEAQALSKREHREIAQSAEDDGLKKPAEKRLDMGSLLGGWVGQSIFPEG